MITKNLLDKAGKVKGLNQVLQSALRVRTVEVLSSNDMKTAQ